MQLSEPGKNASRNFPPYLAARVPHSFALFAKGWDSIHPNLTRFSITIKRGRGKSPGDRRGNPRGSSLENHR
jgi:hypothetical protein